MVLNIQIFSQKLVHSSLLSTELHLCYGDSSILYSLSEFRLQFFVVLRSSFSKCNWLNGFRNINCSRSSQELLLHWCLAIEMDDFFPYQT